MKGLRLLAWRKAVSLRNVLRSLTAWEWGRNAAFALAGLGLLAGLHFGFYRLLSYLKGVPMIGDLLLWKLTAIMLLATFSMVVISSLLTSLSTLYYSFDLKFLMNSPLGARVIFAEKSLESVFFSSWMIGLLMIPYIAALVRANGYGAGFFAVFLALSAPFLALAASFGIGFTLLLLYFFPSSRTRDVIWVLSSFSLALVYGLVRFSEPEKLIRPDALHTVAEYLRYLQAPTASFLPSWWMTKALRAAAFGGWGRSFWLPASGLAAAAVAVYGLLVWAAGRFYFAGYSGAQEGSFRRRKWPLEELPESRWAGILGQASAVLFWKERLVFFRDVKHWSQMILILGLVFVYLFSIQRLPLDNAELRSLVSFLNIGAAGFVIAALGLRFTYPSISLEGRSWWVFRSAPAGLGDLMRQKFLFSAVPMTALALVLGAATSYILGADPFTWRISVASLVVASWGICAMGVGFGALFPQFSVENIHQIESSLGGFVYMASSLFYIGATIMILSWPMRMHFSELFGRAGAWDFRIAAYCAAAWLILNSMAFVVPWVWGRRALERYEG